ncbi:MAG: carboxypeptidase-like regulatory domain-containing protein [Elainella sp. Prado103]|nr:carboxypeptidase-like regulatory domain-containing protein [Elainella sp. Prado103]
MSSSVPVLAHGVAIEYQPTSAYEIRATFDTGEPMANAQVAVYAPTEPTQPWLTGTTDAEGRFVFSPSTSGNWEVQIRQAGHGDVLVIPVQPTGSMTSQAPQPTGDIGSSQPASQSTSPNTVPPSSGSINSYTPLQKGLMMGAVSWGCIGTALFFVRSRKGLERDAHS